MVEDYLTGFTLHCKGWKSVFYNPSRPAFLGSSTTNLNDTLVQGTRWNSGLMEVLFSRFCPLIYDLKSRMPLLERMCYAYLAFQPLYCFPAWFLAIIPQLCLLNGVPIYPKVRGFNLYTLIMQKYFERPVNFNVLQQVKVYVSCFDWFFSYHIIPQLCLLYDINLPAPDFSSNQ